MQVISGSAVTKKTNTVKKGLFGVVTALILIALPLPALAEPAAQTGIMTNAPVASPATNNPTSQTPSPVSTVTSAATPVTTTLTNGQAAAAPVLQTVASPAPAPSSAGTTDQTPQPKPETSATTAAPAASGTGTDKAADTTAKVNTTVNSDAASGNADVSKNRNAGDAKTGDATATATVVNVVNSNGGLGATGNINVFYRDIDGNTQQGDTLIDLSTLQPASTESNQSVGSLQQNTSLTDITNDIALSATSGNATVDGNRNAGDATSGSAVAMANILNIVNSTINAQHSFLGIINVYNNYAGDILVPKSFVDGLLGDSPTGTAPSTTGTLNISNNIIAKATSGNANVADNRNAGDATSGDATTSVTILNLTGRQVIAKNSLLVFVNVLGKWVGMIVQAPGSTTAAYGGGVVSSGLQGQTNDGAGSSTTDANITNNVTVQATSGDASVTNNRNAGNATTGQASSGANILNIANSNFNLGDWFGALFINVFGNWTGNFGIKDDTPVVATTDPADPSQPVQDIKVFRFDDDTNVAPVTGEANVTPSDDTRNDRSFALTATTTTDTPASGAVLGASTTRNSDANTGRAAGTIKIDLVALVSIVGALTLLVALGSLALRRRFVSVRAS